MDNRAKELVSFNKKYWYGYQSPLTCYLGSDGVGHDIIHPMDKFQSACRNAMTLYHASEQLKEDIELKQIEIEALEHSVQFNGTDKTIPVKLRRAKRTLGQLIMDQEEREQAFTVFYGHAMEMLPQIKKYDHFDDAIGEIWACRVAYAASVKNHPLGQELKNALLSEGQKTELVKLMGLPPQLERLPVPNADYVNRVIEGASHKFKKDSEWQKISGSHLAAATLEQKAD